MRSTQIIKRIALYPLAFFRALMEITNNKARDMQYRMRYRHATIDKDCGISEDTRIGKHAHILWGTIINHSVIGDYSYISQHSLVQHAVIGNFCSIANDVCIGLGTHPLDRFSTSPLFYRKNNPLKVTVVHREPDFDEYRKITIGSDVWIGAKAIVMDGVTIGHGAVIAAGAVVTKDVAPYAIVAGVPATLIRYRMDEEARKALLQSKWWEKDVQEILAMEKLLNPLNLHKDEVL